MGIPNEVHKMIKFQTINFSKKRKCEEKFNQRMDGRARRNLQGG